ncbi:hypothetical protein A1O7_06301 [Cladophialophora yegresii CBS 114405]|uniref:Uncharacterized protein n=1 Tax=Cladophialophora yegresii CBS 114405 TaxID=1182544 RepID=W9W2X0_9EURO|nr:uncharacterized protein A1O7_06301 [Cladophialophora yegresii CBS 114405]EXJ58871.1 hypothetical protein A1O7_06301 [Cladophialophora yegresii CBS 114405]
MQMQTPATIDSKACGAAAAAASTRVGPPADEERERMTTASDGAVDCNHGGNVTANTNMVVEEAGVVKATSGEKAGVVHSTTIDEEEDMDATSIADSFSLQDDYIPL